MERGAGQQEMFGLTHTEDGSGKNRTGRANDPIQCHRDRTVVHLAVTNFCYDSERKEKERKYGRMVEAAVILFRNVQSGMKHIDLLLKGNDWIGL